MTTSVKTFAPWTDEQVAKMNEWQACGRVLEFTCPDRHRRTVSVATAVEAFASLHRVPTKAPTRALVATREGMVCTTCGYTQDWALASMLNGAPPNPKLFRRHR